MLAAYKEAFEEVYPDVNVQWMDMGSQQIYDRVSTERNRPQASIWWGSPGTLFDRAAREGLLESYEPSWSEAIDAGSRDPDHFWYGTFLTPEVVAYNTRIVGSGEAPRDWDDILHETWRGRVLIRYPLQSGTMFTIFGAMIMRQPTVEEGYQWLARLDMNTRTYTADPTQLYLRLAREEGAVTLWNMPDIDLQAQEYGYPFDFVIPESGTPVLTDGIAIVRNAPNLERARQFYEFVTTKEALIRQANEFHRIPARSDIAPDDLPEWITRHPIKAMPIDWRRLSEEGDAWMQYWDENIKGRGAAYLREKGVGV